MSTLQHISVLDVCFITKSDLYSAKYAGKHLEARSQACINIGTNAGALQMALGALCETRGAFIIIIIITTFFFKQIIWLMCCYQDLVTVLADKVRYAFIRFAYCGFK